MDNIKTIVILLLRWSLKFVGGFLTVNGIGEEAYLEVAGGVVMALVGVIISLISKKKDLETQPG
jgi:hypothetical protein